ncbi:MAG: DsrE family protein [Deltaproteobacteria bacterium]|nr:DsrE family protein [Candidatus Anaeroferrophillus wilburensis]MBN2889388.1 DsrE family protein [Deltaproteobacteria bacterium]
MNKKVVLVAFNGELMCFVHVLLHAIDLHEQGYDIKVIIEGSATTQVRELQDSPEPFAALFQKVKTLGLIACVCQACAYKMEALDSARQQELPICADMSGHPSLAPYLAEGYQVITF